MPGRHPPASEAADALIAVAPLAHRWIERLLAGHQPPLTVTQFLALRAIATGGASGAELARRSGVSGPAVSQLLAGLADAGLLNRQELAEDRRRQALTLSTRGLRALTSAQSLLEQRFSQLLAELPRPETDALRGALPHLEAALSSAPPPKRPPPLHSPGTPHPPPSRGRIEARRA